MKDSPNYLLLTPQLKSKVNEMFYKIKFENLKKEEEIQEKQIILNNILTKIIEPMQKLIIYQCLYKNITNLSNSLNKSKYNTTLLNKFDWIDDRNENIINKELVRNEILTQLDILGYDFERKNILNELYKQNINLIKFIKKKDESHFGNQSSNQILINDNILKSINNNSLEEKIRKINKMSDLKEIYSKIGLLNKEEMKKYIDEIESNTNNSTVIINKHDSDIKKYIDLKMSIPFDMLHERKLSNTNIFDYSQVCRITVMSYFIRKINYLSEKKSEIENKLNLCYNKCLFIRLLEEFNENKVFNCMNRCYKTYTDDIDNLMTISIKDYNEVLVKYNSDLEFEKTNYKNLF